MSMKKTGTRNRILITLFVIAIANASLADTYELDYTAASSDNTIASGSLTVVGGVATAGSLDITAGPDAGVYTLVTGSGGDSSFDYDNLVTPNSDNGFLDSTGGLLWSLSGNLGDSTEVNLWFNPTAEWGAPADSYSLWGATGPGDYNLEGYGIATLTSLPTPAAHLPAASAADGGWTAVLLAGSMIGLHASRRKLCMIRT